MSVLEKVYCKFKNLEEDYQDVKGRMTRKEYVLYLLGGEADEGAAILTEAIMCENPSTTEELEQFSYVKDLLNFFIKNLDMFEEEHLSFEDILLHINSENEAFGNLDVILSALTKTIMPRPIHDAIYQKDLYKDHGVLHYKITPDGADFCMMSDCIVHRIMSPAHAEICANMYSTNRKPAAGGYYAVKDNKLSRINKGEISQHLSVK